MNDRFLKQICIVSGIIFLLSISFLNDVKYYIDRFFFKDKKLLIIGILSAPENFENRQSIRKTWLKFNAGLSISYYFLIGNEICNIHPLDRSDPYSCLENKIILPKDVSSQTEFTTVKHISNEKGTQKLIQGVTGFGFYVKYGIIIKKLGILRSLLQDFKSEVKLLLKSPYENTVLASATFSSLLLNGTKDNYIIKSIKPVLLPKNFEARVVMELLPNQWLLFQNCKHFVWEEEPGVISLQQLIVEPKTKPWSFTKNSCPNIFMNYVISDVEQLQKQIQSKDMQLEKWLQSNQLTKNNLVKESETYNDLMFLDVTDVYSNLPKKVVCFFEKVSVKEYFHYILKTDDDTFIDVLRVYKQLEKIDKQRQEDFEREYWSTGVVSSARISKFWWWSSVREYWKVQDSGKWRDDKYRSISYPPFPCGGGYVLSKSIVDYINKNSENLEIFQGEDVTVGIWLAALSTTRFEWGNTQKQSENGIQLTIIGHYGNKLHWYKLLMNKMCPALEFVGDSCEWWCENNRKTTLPYCNKGQLSVQKIYETWTSFISKGSL